MSIVEKPAWAIDYKYEYIYPKCDKCDDNREIHYFTPSGKECKESCPYCSVRKFVCFPVQTLLVDIHAKKFESYEKSELKDVELTYVVPSRFIQKRLNNKYDSCYYELNCVYNGEDFNKLGIYDLTSKYYFRDIEDCKRVCDYFNNKEKE